jgi:large subunit ribosomal protein L24
MLTLKKGDTVKILSGKDRGETGKVIFVSGKTGQATVEGHNIYSRHEKPKQSGQKGQKVQFPRPMDASNLMIVCPHCRKPTRVGYLTDEKGMKTRVCKKCQRRF